MSPNWWLEGTNKHVWKPSNAIRCLLAIQVHRQSKEIAVDCTAAPAGQTQRQQRSAKLKHTNDARAEARASAVAAERDADPYFHQEKKLRLMVVNTSILEKRGDMISKHLTLLAKNESSFVRMNGQEAYDEKVNKLLSSLPDPVQALQFDGTEGPDTTDDAHDDNQSSANTNNHAD